MVQQSTIVTSESGIHARPAAELVNFVKNYSGTITIKNGEKSGNLKSILNVMALGIVKGTEVTIEVSGDDEENFCASVIDFINNLKG